MKAETKLLNVPKNDCIQVRIPKVVKDELTREARALGITSISKYILTILLNRK